MSNNSDYTKPRMNLFELLPEVYQSDTNKAVMENLFNRFLSKPDTVKVAGYIGQGNPDAIVNRQIKEFDVHRQAYQLQPILYNKVGSVEWMSSWTDILTEAERLGIDPERLPEWLNLLKFNWIPPIDLDKLINFQDYYWYDPDNANSRPQYLTIRSRCSTAIARFNFEQGLVDEYGALFSILEVAETDEPSSPVQYDKIVIEGQYDRLFETGFVFFVKTSSNVDLNNSFLLVVDSTYDVDTNKTIIQISTPVSDSTADGVISLEERVAAALVERDCRCENSLGWDLGQWDDNPVDPLWDGNLDDWVAAVTGADPTGAPGTDGQQWWDQTGTDRLWIYSTAYGWEVQYNNFSLIIANSTGIVLWDFVDGCGSDAPVNAADQWILQNKWLHKTDVPNFARARQAQIPIIEYDWDLELNEWTYTQPVWRYRADPGGQWSDATTNPEYIELTPLSLFLLDPSQNAIILDERYGDLTNWFEPGRQFMAEGVTEIFVVDYAEYRSFTPNAPGQTVIYTEASFGSPSVLDGAIPGSPTDSVPTTPSSTPLRPLMTSAGDPWRGYNIHWVFAGLADTLPTVHQPENPFTEISPTNPTFTDPSGDFDYRFTYYAQECTVLKDPNPTGSPPFAGVTTFTFDGTLLPGTSRSLQERALIGNNDVRVYVNEQRQYGNYEELQLGSPDPQIGFVDAIRFLTGFETSAGDVVRIEVGEASPQDFGLYAVIVRTVEEDAGYSPVLDNELFSLTLNRKEEQVKTENNQYPLFDIYRVDGSPAFLANQIFGFQTDAESDVNVNVGLRLVVDGANYGFEQFVVEDDGTMYAWRDYANRTAEYWVNFETQQVFFWDGLAWSEFTWMGDQYRRAVVSDIEPADDGLPFEGLYWYDTLNDQLKLYESVDWTVVDALFAADDESLQTIWRKGLNEERYEPTQRDWARRSEAEYNEEKDAFIERRVEELQTEDPLLSDTLALAQATTEWFVSQSNHLSESGEWIGDWEIPDPLYYNYDHENRRLVSFQELVTHFNTIVAEQPKIPAYSGPIEGMFHLIPTNEVNYGLGGKIREYNNAFDTFLSTLFINNVSPRALFVFAHDQYEALLNSLKELLRKEIVDDMLVTSTDSLVDQAEYIAERIIDQHEQNDALSRTYGDSTTFTEVDGADDLGLRNWIATLPYIYFVLRSLPTPVVDRVLGLHQLQHHDGHREDYAFTLVFRSAATNQILTTPDERTRFPSPADPPIDTYGRSSTSLPPNTVTEFQSNFNTSILNREGVYWQYTGGGADDLYRFSVVESGVTEPSSTLPEGVLWLDLNVVGGQLRQKVGFGVDATWVPVAPVGRLHNGDDPSDLRTASISAWKPADLDGLLLNTLLEAETRLYENAPGTERVRYDIEALRVAYPTLYEELLEEAFLAFANENEIIAPLANVDYTAADPFTWNYKFSVPLGPLPSSQNTGSESGGDWRDLYEKLYGTPYPHLEPWRLQGYDDKPTWWDTVYLNDNPRKWGDRRWKYKHGFDVTGTDDTDDYLVIEGDFREVFLNGESIQIEPGVGVTGTTPNTGTKTVRHISTVDSVTPGPAGSATIAVNDFAIFDDVRPFIPDGTRIAFTQAVGSPADYELTGLFTVVSTIYTGPPDFVTIITVAEPIESGVGLEYLTASVYYPSTNELRVHTLGAGSVTAPAPPERILLNDSTHRMMSSPTLPAAYGMWENIRFGVIPAGERYPNNIESITGIWWVDQMTVPETPTMPLYNYFSTNIGNEEITTGGTFRPDDVFPPYWSFPAYFPGSPVPLSSLDDALRSVFYDMSEIVAPSAEYTFGDAGPVEWEWRQSSQFLYDQMTIAFRLDPVRLTQDTFGYETHILGCLEVDKRLEQVASHSNTDFHGDIVDNALLQVDGTNQWYVNYNRYTGFDISMSDFRSMWTLWNAPLMYQFSSFIDTPSLEIAHRQICVSDFDYNISAKRSPGVEDYWLDSFDIAILHAPPPIARYNNQADWRFEIATKSPLGRTIEYYDVQNYQFRANPTTDICTLYTWDVVGIEQSSQVFEVAGNQTTFIRRADQITISSSTGNDGTYTVRTAVYNVVNNTTLVEVEEAIPAVFGSPPASNGLLQAAYRTLPWETGDIVVLSSDETLPFPLQGDTQIGVTQYFVIVLDGLNFQLARTKQDAFNGVFIDLTSSGRRNHFIGRLNGTFNTPHTTEAWRHYVVDTDTTLTFTPPYDVNGIQNVVDIVDGYARYKSDQGWSINDDKSQRDYDLPGRFSDWQRETERFIDTAYNARIRQHQVSEQYEATVALGSPSEDDVWTFIPPGNPPFVTGDPVSILSSNGVYPTPIERGIRYYMIRDSLTEFRLAATQGDANNGVSIDVTSDTGIGTLSVINAKQLRLTRPRFELNPFRHAVWFRPERGIVSNLLTGPTVDLFNTQLFVDQYRRPISYSNMRVFREDKLTTIRMEEGVSNDVERSSVFTSEYNNLHFASCHLFVDTYEHVLIWNDYTSEGQLLYDPFVGLNVTKYEMLFNRQPEFTQRPNVGGHYLSTFFNQGADLTRNIEAGVEDLRYLYDTYQVQESNPLTIQSRQALGYEGTQEFFDLLNMPAKSQFAFWRGAIQAKGSINAVEAFINSKRFIDAKLDEFWAVKVADFGSAAEKEYLEMWLNSEDARSNELRLTSQFVSTFDIACEIGFDTNPFDVGCGYDFPTETTTITTDATSVSGTDEDRWKNQPDQLQSMRDQAALLNFELKPVDKLNVVISSTPPAIGDGEAWVNPSEGTPAESAFYRWEDNTQTAWVDGTGNVTQPEHGRWAAGGTTGTAYLRHDFESDYVTITMDWLLGEYCNITGGSPFCCVSGSPANCGLAAPGSPAIAVVEVDLPVPYLINTNSLRVFRDGALMANGEDYEEVDVGGVFGTQIRLTAPLGASKIDVVMTSAELVEGVHFTIVNSNIIQVSNAILVDGANFRMWGWLYDKGALNPAKLIDTQAEVVVSPVTVWDPARDMHYYNGIHTVQLQNVTDPAVYTSTPRTNQAPDPTFGLNKIYNVPWNKQEVGTTWMDTFNMQYIPYYDEGRFSDIDDRLRLWGSLADWGSFKIYAWVESDVPPNEWDALAASEEGDVSIPEDIRKSGRVKESLFERDASDEWQVARDTVDQFDILIDAVEVVSGSEYDLPLSNIQPVTESVLAVELVEAPNVIAITIPGLYSQRLLPGMDVAINNVDVYEVQAAESDVETDTTVVTVEGGLQEVTEITTVADVEGSLRGTHFNIDGPDTPVSTTPYYMWYNVASRPEITEVTVTGDTSGDLAGTYFTFTAADGLEYFAWYDMTTPERPEVTDVEPVADVGGSLNGTYFTLQAVESGVGGSPPVQNTQDYYVWYGVLTQATSVTCGNASVLPQAAPLGSPLGSPIITVPGGYFTLNAANDTTNYYVWYNVTDVSAPNDDPAPGGTGLQVDVLSTDLANAVASKTQAVIDANADFGVPVPGANVITITNTAVGTATPAADVSTTFGVSTSTAVNPAIGSPTPSGIGIQVTLNGGESAVDVAVATDAAVGAGSPALFNTALVGSPTDTVRITNVLDGYADDATAGTSGFTVIVVTQGLAVGPPPAPNGIPVPVTIAENDLANTVVNATVQAINDLDAFTAEIATAPTLRITTAENADVTDATAGTTAFPVIVTQQGFAPSVDPMVLNRTAVQVDVDTNASAMDVATATQVALDGVNGLTATLATGSPISSPIGSPLGTNVVTVTASMVADVPDATSETTGFGIVVLQQGLAPTIGSTLKFYERVDIYVNGQTVQTNAFVPPITGTITITDITLPDRIHVIRHPVPTFDTQDEADAFVAVEVGFGTLLQEVEYTVVPFINDLGIEQNMYYFWVEDKTTRDGDKMSPFNAETSLLAIPIPYMLFQSVQPAVTVPYGGTRTLARTEHQTTVAGQTVLTTQLPIVSVQSVFVTELFGSPLYPSGSPQPELTPVPVSYTPGTNEITLLGSPPPAFPEGPVVINYTGVYDATADLPIRFTDVVILGLRGLIDEDRRFVLRWTRDFTLRDTLENGKTPLQLKPLHEEWQLIRQEQPFSLPRWLWDKVTESMVGYLLADPSVRVPSYERELFDDRYDDETQYGIGVDQTFTDGTLALTTILTYLNDPDNDFSPVDINVFFANNNFDSDDAIVASMNEIYTTFPFAHVNRMWFSVLADAFSLKAKYEDIFKTSMVSLFGVRPFQIAGIFDD